MVIRKLAGQFDFRSALYRVDTLADLQRYVAQRGDNRRRTDHLAYGPDCFPFHNIALCSLITKRLTEPRAVEQHCYLPLLCAWSR